MHDFNHIAADAKAFRRAVREGMPYRPLYIKMKLVWTCNLRCTMCRHWQVEKADALPTDAFLPWIDELAELGCQKLHLTGGEPTLRRDLETLIERASRQGIRVSMTTNGTTITPRRGRSLVDAGLRRANVSIDSPLPDVHDAVRGVEGSWQRTVTGFGVLRDALGRRRLRINTVISASNYRTLAVMPSFAARLGASDLNLIPLDPHTPGISALNREQIEEFNADIAPRIEREGMQLGLLRHRDVAYPFGRGEKALQDTAASRYAQGYYDHHRCYAPFAHTLIDHAGQVSICCMTVRKPILGDLKTSSFTEVWQGAAYRALRTSDQRPLLDICKHCDMFVAENRRLDRLMTRPAWLCRLQERLS